MPKEIVVSHLPNLFDEKGLPVEQDRQGLVQIGWNAEQGHVQIATFARNPITYETVFDGYYVDLERDQINDLIRYLRRARNAVFGADE